MPLPTPQQKRFATLTPKQKHFCKEYIIDKNATQAAIRAGYSSNCAQQISADLMKNEIIQEKISFELQGQLSRADITAERVILELGKLAFSNMDDFVTIDESGDAVVDLSLLTRDQAAALSEITVDEYTEGKGEGARDVKKVKIKLSDKHGSLTTLARYFKLLTDKVEHSGAIHTKFLREAAKKAEEVSDDGDG